MVVKKRINNLYITLCSMRADLNCVSDRFSFRYLNKNYHWFPLIAFLYKQSAFTLGSQPQIPHSIPSYQVYHQVTKTCSFNLLKRYLSNIQFDLEYTVVSIACTSISLIVFIEVPTCDPSNQRSERESSEIALWKQEMIYLKWTFVVFWLCWIGQNHSRDWADFGGMLRTAPRFYKTTVNRQTIFSFPVSILSKKSQKRNLPWSSI